MMQMPLLSYPHFSQFLQLQQQQQLQERYSRAFFSSTRNADVGMLSSHRSATSCSEASTGTPSPSPSPPLSITDNYNANQGSSKTAKSFTIDAILGIRDREMDKMNRDRANVVTSSFHPRLGLHLPGSLDVSASFSNSMDIINSSLEIGARRLDVNRHSTASRDILSFQLPTDLTMASDVSNFGSEINRRDLPHHISSFSSSNSSNRLSDKSSNDGSKKCGGKSKRVRTIFTPEQLERLEAEFERQQYMVGPERLYLAHTLQLTEAQVKVWFQNRRIKWRKQHLEIQQQRLAAIKQQSQRSEVEDTDDESGDSNNYSFSTDTNDNHGSSFFKSPENISELESGAGNQFRDDVVLFQSESTGDNLKCEPVGEGV